MSEVDHVERIQLGVVAACVFAFAYGVVWLIAQNPAEVARGAGLVVAFLGSIYVLGYSVSKCIALTPVGRARAAEAAKQKADRQIEETVPATMVVLNAAIDSRYASTVCTLFGPETQLFPVGPGTATEIIEQAKAVSDEHCANTLCIYLVDNNLSVTYVKSPAGEWTRGWDDEGSAGVGRLAKRALSNQKLHEQAAS